jgi:hypothetical protein
MGRFFSNELFHFVGRSDPQNHEGNFAVLWKILSSKCVSHPPHEPGWGTTSIHINWGKALSNEKLIVPNVVCFCDIPFEHLPIHLIKYELFGLSLDKGRLTKFGARPVTYIPLRADNKGSPFGAQLLRTFEQTYRGFREQLFDKDDLPRTRMNVHGAKPQTPGDTLSALDALLAKDVLAFLKPFNSELADEDPEYYYAEREWRKLGNLVFEPADVHRVVVAPGFVERLESEFPIYKGRIQSAPK